MPERSPSRLGPENPWPGLDSFGEGDSAYFHGRDAEVAELGRLVRRERLTVLFGQSGLGKTSLLGAGLFPHLRDQGFVPVLLRIDFSGQGPPPQSQVLDALVAECARTGVEAPRPEPGQTLWAYFHRADTEFWSAKNRPVTPVLAFDQFEEAFTRGQQSEQSRGRCRAFLDELGDLVENRVPAPLKAGLDDDPDAALHYDFGKSAFKLVLSFREDFLAAVEGLKRQIPSLSHNRLRLRPMDGLQAREVVLRNGAHLVDEAVAARIIGVAAGLDPALPPPEPDGYAGLQIDPALLSVICSELNARRLRAGQTRITADLISGAETAILANFYERCVDGLDPRVRIFVEDELLTDKGYRDSYPLDDAISLPGISSAAVDGLVARRLLRVDERFGIQQLELTHDVLTRVVQDSRDSRQAREAEAAALLREREAARKQRRNRLLLLLLLLGFAGVAGAAAYVYGLKGQVTLLQATADRRLLEAQAAEQLAQQAKQQAEQAQARALEEERAATVARASAAEARTEAEQQQRRATLLGRQNDATELLTKARQLQDSDYDLALLLNRQAARLSPTMGVRAGLVDRFEHRPRLDGMLAAPQPQPLRAVRYSPDGRWLAAAGADQSVLLWDARSRKPPTVLRGHRGQVFDLAFAADSRLLASAGDDGRVIVWDLASGQPRNEIAGSGAKVSYVAFSADGRVLAASTQRGQVGLWDARGGSPLAPLEGEGGAAPAAAFARAIAFSPDGQKFAAASADKSVTLWDLASRRQLCELSGHRENVLGLAFSPDGRSLATASEDQTLRLWDAQACKPRGAELKGHGRKVWSVAFSADGRLLASAGEDRLVMLWDAASGAGVATLEGHQGRVNGVAFSPDHPVLASAGDDMKLMLWDVARAPGPELKLASPSPLLGQALAQPSAVWGLALSPNGRTLAVAGEGRGTKPCGKDFCFLVSLWDLAARKALPALEGHTEKVNAVAFSPDGRTLASASDDTTVLLWSLAGRQVSARLVHGDNVRGLAYSPDGKMLASAGADGRVVLWDTARGQPHATLAGQHRGVWSVAFDRDGRTLASAHEDGAVLLWDVASARLLTTLTGHTGRVVAVAFSPDGRLLASGSADKRVALWDLASRKPLAWLDQPAKEVRGLAFSPQGDVLASVGDDKRVLLWEVALRKLLTTLEGHQDRVRAVAFGPDGRTLVSGGDDKSVISWRWDLDALAAQACRVAGRELTAAESKQYLGALPDRLACAAPAR